MNQFVEKHGSALTLVIAAITLILGILGTVGGAIAWGVSQVRTENAEHREVQRDQREAYYQAMQQQQEAAAKRAEIPELRPIGGRYDEQGYTLITLQHGSKTHPANITSAMYTISDPKSLDYIRRVHPPKPSPGGHGAMNHVDDVFFREGFWAGDNYCYMTNVSLNIPPGPASDLRLAIIDPKMAGAEFSGHLDVYYSSGNREIRTELPVGTVVIKVRAK
jgi:hypothetical protein